MAKESTLIDSPEFVDIGVVPMNNGIDVSLGGQGKLLNYEDAQFLCDALYVLLDDLRLDEENGDG